MLDAVAAVIVVWLGSRADDRKRQQLAAKGRLTSKYYGVVADNSSWRVSKYGSNCNES